MRALFWLVMCGVVVGCKGQESSSGPPVPTSAGRTPPKPPDALCGLRPTDWCPSPPGDPCGAHRDVTRCRADPRCKGMPYRGESAVACLDDGTGFAKNCPTVGCVSR